jgi:hypothetical protein
MWGIGLTFLLLIGLYVFYGFPTLTVEVQKAITNIGTIGYQVAWGLSYIVLQPFAIRRFFLYEYEGYALKLFDCQNKEALDEVLVEDVVLIWRKWLFWQFWTVTFVTIVYLSAMIIAPSWVAHPKEWLGTWTVWVAVSVVGGFYLRLVLQRFERVRIKKVVSSCDI